MDAALARLDALHLDVRAHRRENVIAAAELIAPTQPLGTGLGDRTFMALAIAEGFPARIRNGPRSSCQASESGSPDESQALIGLAQ